MTLRIPIGTQCGTVQSGRGRYVNHVVIQANPVIMQVKKNRITYLKCNTSLCQSRVIRWSVLLIYSRQMQQRCWNDWEVKRETEYGGSWIRSGYKANSGQKQLTDYQSASAMASCLVGHHCLALPKKQEPRVIFTSE